MGCQTTLSEGLVMVNAFLHRFTLVLLSMGNKNNYRLERSIYM